MIIDYSLEDLEQLLTVSSKAEYMGGLFCLHDAFKNVMKQYDALSSNNNITDLLDDVKLGIAENQILLQGSIGKPETEIISTSMMPPLFNHLDSTNADEMFKKNFVQYSNVVNILNNSYKQFNGGDSDDVQTSIKENCDNWIMRWNEANSIVNDKPDDKAKNQDNDKSKNQDNDKSLEDITCNVCIDPHVNISDISDEMGKNLGKFTENFNSLNDGRKSVNDCMNQLSLFALKGLQVESAIAPLKSQLKGIENIQAEYLTKLMKINQEFDSIINDMTKVTELGVSE